jgi:hypothetical protein
VTSFALCADGPSKDHPFSGRASCASLLLGQKEQEDERGSNNYYCKMRTEKWPKISRLADFAPLAPRRLVETQRHDPLCFGDHDHRMSRSITALHLVQVPASVSTLPLGSYNSGSVEFQKIRMPSDGSKSPRPWGSLLGRQAHTPVNEHTRAFLLSSKSPLWPYLEDERSCME